MEVDQRLLISSLKRQAFLLSEMIFRLERERKIEEIDEDISHVTANFQKLCLMKDDYLKFRREYSELISQK